MNTGTLTIRLLGAFVLERDGQEVGGLSRSAKCLLSLIILRRKMPPTRESLAGMIWQDATHERSLFYLRRSLAELRVALGSGREQLIATGSTLGFDSAGIVCDVIDFERLAARKDEATLEQAAALYRGTLLEGIQADFLTAEREHFAVQYLTILETLAEFREQRGAWKEALEPLRRVVVCDNLREAAHCRIMEILGKAGDFAGVERQYRELRRVLRSELNMEPSVETVQCYQRWKAQAQSVSPISAFPSSPMRHLPIPLTSLIGRSQDRVEVAALLQHSRLVTLLGPGGVGKTRLAIAIADEVASRFDNGVWFADLTPVITEESLPQFVLASLAYVPAHDREPLDALCRFLQRKQLLLILDNAEHLRDACARLTKHLLQECPLLSVLCTSREPLGISGECVRNVVPLSVPPKNNASRLLSEQEFTAYDSVALLLVRIAHVAPEFRLTSDTLPAIVQICRRLDGLPLALELAAACFRSMTASEIAARLDVQFRLLTSGDPSNARHRTLRATLDWSYNLLNEAERCLLRSVSVFADGWTFEAAEAICRNESEDTFVLMMSLADKSLLVAEEQQNGQTRYRLLEMTRAYASEQFDAEDEALLRRRHAEFFMAMAQTANDQIVNHNYEPTDWRDALQAECENFRVAHAWWQLHDSNQALWLELFLYGTWVWLVSSKRKWIARVVAAEPDFTPLGAQLNYLAGCWAMWIADPAAEPLLRQAIAISDVCGSVHWAISAWSALSEWYQENGRLTEALSCIEAGLTARYQEPNSYFFARLNARAANLMVLLGDEVAARERLQPLLVQGRRTGDLRTLSYIFEGIAKIAYSQKQYQEAYDYLREYVQIVQQYQPFDVPEAWRLLGNAAREMQEYAEAQRCYDKALTTCRIHSRQDRAAWTYWGMAVLAFRQGDLAGALERLALASAVFDELDEPRSMMQCLRYAANYHFAFHDNERAAVILGSIERICAEYAFAGMAGENAEMKKLNAQLQSQLSQEELKRLKKQGAMMIREQVTEYAFETRLHHDG